MSRTRDGQAGLPENDRLRQMDGLTMARSRDGLRIKWFRFHVLRHTFVSLLLHKGLEMPIVSKIGSV
jgi:integrase